MTDWPSVTIVFLVYNRREELRQSLQAMLQASRYPGEVDAIVVDNASSDGSAEMVEAEFPTVQVIRRQHNAGVSGWNDGLRAARGEYILALDDDCYLPPDGLAQAVSAAQAAQAGMVSFKVLSTHDPERTFNKIYRTGMFMFWGCAVLWRREVVDALGGYDPEIFVWANELEFTLRFFDRGFRHLYLPSVTALHMKELSPPGGREFIPERAYRLNARHWGYIAAKLLWPRDALETLVALLVHQLRDAVRMDPVALKAPLETLRGFLHGLRHRRPLRNRRISRFYRHNFETFASPWWLSRTPIQLLRALPRELIGAPKHQDLSRRELYFARRQLLYPETAGLLWFSPQPVAVPMEGLGQEPSAA